MNEAEVFQYLQGGVIDGGGVTEDGFHFFLKDGRVLVVGQTDGGEVYFGVALADERQMN